MFSSINSIGSFNYKIYILYRIGILNSHFNLDTNFQFPEPLQVELQGQGCFSYFLAVKKLFFTLRVDTIFKALNCITFWK